MSGVEIKCFTNLFGRFSWVHKITLAQNQILWPKPTYKEKVPSKMYFTGPCKIFSVHVNKKLRCIL